MEFDDPDDIFRDDEDDADARFSLVGWFGYSLTHYSIFFSFNMKWNEIKCICLLTYQENESNKEYVVFLIDASPKMFTKSCPAVSLV